MNVTTAARFNPAVFRSAPPPPQESSVLDTVTDTFCRAGNMAMVALPGAVIGGGAGVGAAFWPAMAIGGRVGAGMAAGMGLVGAAVGGYVTYSLSQMD